VRLGEHLAAHPRVLDDRRSFERIVATQARRRAARQDLPDDAFIAALCGTVLDGAPTAEPTGRAMFQIAVTVCERCRQGWQHGAGAKLAICPAAVERALCDAQHLGSLDGDAPARAHQDIPPSVVRFVWRRDGGRCRLPGCRSAHIIDEIVTALHAYVSIASAFRDGMAFWLANARRSNPKRDRETGRLRSRLTVVGARS